jgi:flagellar basal body-associated protein FliL
MAGELKKKILKRDQAAATESEGVQGPGTETGEAGAPVEGKKAGTQSAGLGPRKGNKTDGVPAQAEDGKSDEEGLREAGSWWKQAFLKKALIFGVPTVILALGAWLFFFKFGSNHHILEPPEQKLVPVTGIKRPVPIPDYHEMLDFIILNETEGHKTMLALRMEFTFHNPATYQNFKEQNVVFRDMVYSFLLRQNALRNTSSSWHTVVEKDLFEYLRVKLPQSKADQIRLTQVENL